MSGKNPSIKDILQAVGLLKSADPSVVSALATDEALVKSLSQTAEPLSPAEHVDDIWLKGQRDKTPTREEVKIGPSQSASGGGAERMIDDYSNPARQMYGVQQVAERFEHILSGFSNAAKSIVAESAKTNALIQALVAKAAEEESEEEEDEEEESEVVEINASRGKSHLGKARKLLRKAEDMKEAMEDEDDKDKKKACKAQIKKLIKSAIKALLKARDCAYAAKSAELKKDIQELIALHEIRKADINVVQEEEEEEEDEEEEEGEGKGKSQTAAAASPAAAPATEKAKTDDAGHQADRADPASGNQAAASKAEVDPSIKAQIEQAVAGLAMLTTTVNGIMDVVSGKTKVTDLAPVVKSEGIRVPELYEQIREKNESGIITDIEAYAAREIAQKVELAKSGKYDIALVNDRLSKASTAVQNLFKDSGFPAVKAA